MIDLRNPNYQNTPVAALRPSFCYASAKNDLLPQLSIITPFFNTGAVFHQTARSVFGQSFVNWEWLIVNDGSNDPDSLCLLDSYRQRDARIRVIDHFSNRGLPAARNTGYLHARSSLVYQLDSDDLIEPTALEKFIWALTSYPEYSFVSSFQVGFAGMQYLSTWGFHESEAFLQENRTDSMALVRREVHQAIGGYDESIRGGFEDWDYWLRAAANGYWGTMVPEFLEWYRRRPAGEKRWTNWDQGTKQESFRDILWQKYPSLLANGFPRIPSNPQALPEELNSEIPLHNVLQKNAPRLLIILPRFEMGGAERFDLNLVKVLTQRGWELTLVATEPSVHLWLSSFSSFTPDIFVLPNFLKFADYPRFLRYLICSRQPEMVMVTQSEMAYLLLPYLRHYCPAPRYVDYTHIVESQWYNGGYPRLSVDWEAYIDLHLVSSQHLKSWMESEGLQADKVTVTYTNVDTKLFEPSPPSRLAMRQALQIPAELPLILFAGRFVAQKQPRLCAAVIAQLQAQGLEFMCLLAGGGEEAKWLEDYIKQKNLSQKMRLLGEIPEGGMPGLLAASDIFFLPSRWEGISLAIYEAMSSGLAVVSAAVGGQAELLSPECGVLIEPAEEELEKERYVQALADLLRFPEKMKVMGARARARVEKYFTLAHLGERLEENFEQTKLRQSADFSLLIEESAANKHTLLVLEYLKIARQSHEEASALEGLREKCLHHLAKLQGLDGGIVSNEQQISKLRLEREKGLKNIESLEQHKNELQQTIIDELRNHGRRTV